MTTLDENDRLDSEIKRLCNRAQEKISGSTYRLELFDANQVVIFSALVERKGTDEFVWQRNYPEITGPIEMHLTSENQTIETSFDFSGESADEAESEEKGIF